MNEQTERSIRNTTWSRWGIILTLLMDGTLIALAILVRAGILSLTAWVAEFTQPGWAILAVALIADFGLVAAAAVVTLVDLIILVRDSISQLRTHEAIGN